jgi:hypothetical protein
MKTRSIDRTLHLSTEVTHTETPMSINSIRNVNNMNNTPFLNLSYRLRCILEIIVVHHLSHSHNDR